MSELGKLVCLFRREQAIGNGQDDGQLLERFVTLRDKQAFETIMERHGSMVFGVCRSVLGHRQDAEDACQATFLVLVKKAKSIRKRASLAGWLHGAAHRTALAAQRQAIRLRDRENSVRESESEAAAHAFAKDEMQRMVHEVLARLSEPDRTVLLECEINGRSHGEVAELLGISKPALSQRVWRARERLRQELFKLGVSSPVILAGALASTILLVRVPNALAASTLTAASGLLSGASLASLVSARVAGLVHESIWHGVRGKLLAALFGLMLAGGGTAFGFSVASPSNPPVSARGPEPVAVKPEEKKDNPKKAVDERQARRQKSLDNVCVPTLIKELESIGGSARKIMAEPYADFALVKVRWTHAFQGFKGPWTVQVKHHYRLDHEMGIFYGDDVIHFVNPDEPMYYQPIHDGRKFVFGKTHYANISKAFTDELDTD